MTIKFPTIRKEFVVEIEAWHNLRGVTTHPDAMVGTHSHRWTIAVIFEHEYNPMTGFQRDEAALNAAWGARIRELDGRDLSKMMKLPATAENFSYWLLLHWLPRLSDQEINHEPTGVRVTKDGHSCEVRRNEANKRGWMSFGGEVA